jgi:hypothetical protein
MRLEIRRVHSLPRLAWCALLKKGEDAAVVYIGPWVEAKKDCFFEGAWDGIFQEYRFDRSTALCGSGGLLQKEGILFSTPSHLNDCLKSIHLGEELLVSNSFIFLQVLANDSPDMSYPFYIHDIVKLHQTAFSKKPLQIRTKKGNHIDFHFSCNFLVKSDLSIFRQEKNIPESPRDYEEYFRLLDGTLKSVIQNAVNPKRKHLYEPLATISKGYDSTATSVLAQQAGCQEAVTFAKIDSQDTAPDDSGKIIGERLGLKVTEYDLQGFKSLPGFPEAEFTACSAGLEVGMSVMEKQLARKLLVTGRPGDSLWSKWRIKLLFSRDVPTNQYATASSLNEFRLRVGFLRCPILFVTSRDRLSTYQITLSREMKSWSIGGPYDRPIARRIVESAGIPRTWFGQKKMAYSYVQLWRAGNMSKRSHDDFTDFLNTKIPALSFKTRIKYLLMICSYFLSQAAGLFFKKIAGFFKIPFYILPDVHKPTKYVFTFHWGFFKIKDRYRIDPTHVSFPGENS